MPIEQKMPSTSLTRNTVISQDIHLNNNVISGMVVNQVDLELSGNSTHIPSSYAVTKQVQALNQKIDTIDPSNNFFQDNYVISLPLLPLSFKENDPQWPYENWECFNGSLIYTYSAISNKIEVVNSTFSTKGKYFLSIKIDRLDSGEITVYDKNNVKLKSTDRSGYLYLILDITSVESDSFYITASKVNPREFVMISSIGVYKLADRYLQHLDSILYGLVGEGSITEEDLLALKIELLKQIQNVDTKLVTHQNAINPHNITAATIGAISKSVLDAALLTKADSIHGHSLENIQGLNPILEGLTNHTKDESNPHKTSYDQVGAAPTVHTHVYTDLTGVAASKHNHEYIDLTGVAAIQHGHSVEDISGLNENLIKPVLSENEIIYVDAATGDDESENYNSPGSVDEEGNSNFIPLKTLTAALNKAEGYTNPTDKTIFLNIMIGQGIYQEDLIIANGSTFITIASDADPSKTATIKGKTIVDSNSTLTLANIILDSTSKPLVNNRSTLNILDTVRSNLGMEVLHRSDLIINKATSLNINGSIDHATNLSYDDFSNIVIDNVNLNKFNSKSNIGHIHQVSDIEGLEDLDLGNLGDLTALTTKIDTHIADTNNPHGTTIAQIGAAPTIHTHILSDITNLGDLDLEGLANLQTSLDEHISNTNNPHSVTLTQLGGVSTSDLEAGLETRAILGHTHVLNDITDLGDLDLSGLSELTTTVNEHITNENNPHKVNLEQLNAYSKTEVDTLLENKTDIGHTHEISDINGLTELGDVSGLVTKLDTHIEDKNNPHEVTAEQINVFTKDDITTLLDTKLNKDLSNLETSIGLYTDLKTFDNGKRVYIIHYADSNKTIKTYQQAYFINYEFTDNTVADIIFDIPFSNTNYIFNGAADNGELNLDYLGLIGAGNKTTSGFKLLTSGGSYSFSVIDVIPSNTLVPPGSYSDIFSYNEGKTIYVITYSDESKTEKVLQQVYFNGYDTIANEETSITLDIPFNTTNYILTGSADNGENDIVTLGTIGIGFKKPNSFNVKTSGGKFSFVLTGL